MPVIPTWPGRVGRVGRAGGESLSPPASTGTVAWSRFRPGKDSSVAGMPKLLGIDLGTSGLKAVIFDLEGRLLGIGRARNRYLSRPTGWAEQDPESWWAGCCLAIRAALDQAGGRAADVVAAGVCGFHHCPVFLDGAGNPVRPTIVTHDSRLAGSRANLAQDGILAEVERISGSRVMTGHFPPIYHLVRTHDSRSLAETRWILLAKDYVRYRLTDRIGTEICDATGTNLIAMPQATWSDRLCALLEVPRDKLPEIGSPAQIAGQVTQAAASATGLEPGTPVVYGGGDSHCALAGLGVVGSGEAGLLLGTNSTLRASFEGLVKPGEQMVWSQQHVVPGRFTVSASSMAGSSVLSWFRDVYFGQDLEGAASYRELESLASEIAPGCDGLLFHPYLFGERSPFYNPEAKGAFLGIRHWHGRGHLVRSVMEGVAFAIANCADAVQAIAQEAGQPVTVLRTGKSGGSRLPIWRQIIADALDHALEVAEIDEPGCLGAALLAGAGIGLYENLASASRQVTRIAIRTVPDPVSVAVYRDRRAVFNDTYSALESHLG